MTRMGIAAVYRKPRTSQWHPAYTVLSLSVAPSGDHASESRLGGGHHLYSDEARLRVFVRRFTRQEFTGFLKDQGIQISMDGKGCWRDNVFVERLWKSIKYEEVYLHAYETVSAAQQGLARYLTFYNQTRPHRALDGHASKWSVCGQPAHTAHLPVGRRPRGST
jgi:hypothetical protein